MTEKHPLKAYREENGLNRKALADALAVTEVTVGRWENGKRGVRKSLLPQIEDKFGISAARILEFERAN
jgi:transcriptional regulator with XRE-family HTH domain